MLDVIILCLGVLWFNGVSFYIARALTVQLLTNSTGIFACCLLAFDMYEQLGASWFDISIGLCYRSTVIPMHNEKHQPQMLLHPVFLN
jgi:hypothetical protein